MHSKQFVFYLHLLIIKFKNFNYFECYFYIDEMRNLKMIHFNDTIRYRSHIAIEDG